MVGYGLDMELDMGSKAMGDLREWIGMHIESVPGGILLR
jgi:hypothetical protein